MKANFYDYGLTLVLPGWRAILASPRPHGAIIICAFAVGWVLWNAPVLSPMDERGTWFLCTIAVAVMFWIYELVDEYLVGLMLLVAWVVLDIVPANVALSGFSHDSWFFVVGSFGIAAAIRKTSLLQRLALGLLSWTQTRRQHPTIAVLLGAGAFSTPVLPSGKARAAIIGPLAQSISDTAGFGPRSNGGAALGLAAFIGFTQMQFMFLSGAEQNLIGWNLLPASAKSEFGWLIWFFAALPGAVFIGLFTLISLRYLLPLPIDERRSIARQSKSPPKNSLPAMARHEWIALITLALTVGGWLTSAVHGLSEAWVAMGALLVFLLSGVLDKESFRNEIDWGLVLFFGVLNSLSFIAQHLNVHVWLMGISKGFIARFDGEPLAFLLAVFVLVAVTRFFLRKASTAALVTMVVLPLGEPLGIHPGVLLLTVLMSGECFLFPYQDGPYQIAYATTRGSVFSHAQARRVLAAKYLATLLAIGLSVPYWRFLGLIDSLS